MTTPQTEVPADDTVSKSPVKVGPTIGFKSSEFATTLATVAAVTSGHIPANYVPLVSALAGLYVACRTTLKAVHALGYAKQIADLPDLPKGA